MNGSKACGENPPAPPSLPGGAQPQTKRGLRIIANRVFNLFNFFVPFRISLDRFKTLEERMKTAASDGLSNLFHQAGVKIEVMKRKKA